ncbi:hypothetical protein [Massilia sp. LjRoot122]|uniref:hypothetical protein n=1 Tax=Massilia sp. LjRoot122 TaxID=3342257 RepID=UPI003ECED23A
MTTSCSDFHSHIWNRLVALNLISGASVDPEDLDAQSTMALEAITTLSDKVSLLANLLEQLVGKLPANDAQVELPLGTAELGSLEPDLREKIMTALRGEALREAVHGPAARFMQEVLDAHDCVAGIVEQYNDLTLADVLYLHSAIHKKGYIEVLTPTDSRICELVRQLPSADFWQAHIFVIAETMAA